MIDFMDKLALDAKATVDSGYYNRIEATRHVTKSLRSSILLSRKMPIITEVKAASPSKGVIRHDFSPEEISKAMARGGAVGISVLTEPNHFNGSVENLAKIREISDLPLLMKDIVVSQKQLDAAFKLGANAVLLIQTIFDRGYCSLGLDEMIAKAHSNNLEVLLEAHTANEFKRAMSTNTDLVGINNRNLGTLKIDLNTTKNILAGLKLEGKVVVSESGISTPAELRFLHDCGAQAFLIGSAVMSADDVESKVREFVNA